MLIAFLKANQPVSLVELELNLPVSIAFVSHCISNALSIKAVELQHAEYMEIVAAILPNTHDNFCHLVWLDFSNMPVMVYKTSLSIFGLKFPVSDTAVVA